jgi:hypothetical protein
MKDFGTWWTITIAAAEATPPPAKNGIDPLEYLTLQVSYDSSSSLSEMIQLGQLQVAMHVTGQPDGESDTFVNGIATTVIPEPSAFLLIGCSASFVIFIRRRFLG